MAPRVYFSPKGGLTNAYVAELDKATVSIHAQYYTLTSQPVVDAMLRARKRKVKVEVILDRMQLLTSKLAADALLAAKAVVLVDPSHQIAHNKVSIIDNRAVLGGSFNPSMSGETRNAENMVVDVRKTMVEKFEENYQAHKAHSILYATTPVAKRKLTKAELKKIERLEMEAIQAEADQR